MKFRTPFIIVASFLLFTAYGCGGGDQEFYVHKSGEDTDPTPTTFSLGGSVTISDWPTDVTPTVEIFENEAVASSITSVKIGMLSPQTGPIAQYAPGFEDAGAIAISALNETHKGNFEFELIIGDSGCDGTQAATAAQTLVDSGGAVSVGAACSGATLGASAVAAPAGVPMVSYASTAP